MRIQTLSGKATQVRHSPLTATFRIGVRPVSVNFHQVVHIEEGDDVKVAGRMSKGIIHAYAYNNITTGAKGNIRFAEYIISLALLALLALVLVGLFFDPLMWIFPIFSFPFFLFYLPLVVMLILFTIAMIRFTFKAVDI